MSQRIIEKSSMRLWSISKNRNEFDQYRTLLDGSLQHTLTAEALNTMLLPKAVGAMQGVPHVVAVHDASPIRKPNARKLEALGVVRSLENTSVRGYETFNTVLISLQDKRLRLLRSTPFSNGSDDFRSAASVKTAHKERRGLPKEDLSGLPAIEVASEESIIRLHLRCTHDALAQANPDTVLTHVLDRRHDDNGLFAFIDQTLGDKFVIRLKASRTSGAECTTSEGKTVAEKMLTMPMKQRVVQHCSKVRIAKRVLQDVRLVIEYDTVTVKGRTYGLVRVNYLERTGKPVFKAPMLLLTNHALTSDEAAKFVYRLYGQRSRIEEVFHFLKTVLGWEDIQVRDWQSIQALITLCFFIGGYFYEIDSALTHNLAVQTICHLGGGKGKFSRLFFLRGLASMMLAQSVQTFFQENHITPEVQKEMFDFVAAYKT
jgi:Transposase DDE domain